MQAAKNFLGSNAGQAQDLPDGVNTQLVRPSEKFDTSYMTTNTGGPVYNNLDSLSIGRRGPLLLEDYHLIEKIAQFDRERIPERVVHARGAGAKGYFEVTHDISNLTVADMFREVGVQTPVIARFSTVIHERGSLETLRDVRGFSVKFYTREGNWDFVGNNIPVFFVRDGIAFPDLIHAFKPNPQTNIQEFWRIWDFLSHHPESCNVMTYLLDDDGIPLNYRHMQGFSVNTFRLINKEGKETYVKFIWTPKQGIKNLLDDEAIQVGGSNDRHATADLFENIEKGNYPEWEFGIQTMDPADEDKYEFDPLDDTKIFPEDRFPIQPIGKMVLNKNVDNFFQENEMLAFNPGITVPGIHPSNDKLLQSRIFSYSDSQRHRLGPNYLTLPVNMPKNQHHQNHWDGFMNYVQRDNQVNYFPSSVAKLDHAKEYPIPQETLEGKREKKVIPKENNFQQPGERFRSWPKDRQDRFITRVTGKLADPKLPPQVRQTWAGYWTQCDEKLGGAITKFLNENKLV